MFFLGQPEIRWTQRFLTKFQAELVDLVNPDRTKNQRLPATTACMTWVLVLEVSNKSARRALETKTKHQH